MILYEFGFSRSARCHWVLAEVNAQYESVTVDLYKGQHKKPEFLKINPYGKLPVLKDGDNIICESAAICTYVAEKFPDAGLIPEQGTIDRAHYYQWICYCLAELEPYLWIIRKNTAIYPKQERSLPALKQARKEYLASVSLLEDRMREYQYILGSIFSAADIIIAYNLIWADSINLLKNFVSLRHYIDKMKQRPSFPQRLLQDPN